MCIILFTIYIYIVNVYVYYNCIIPKTVLGVLLNKDKQPTVQSRSLSVKLPCCGLELFTQQYLTKYC